MGTGRCVCVTPRKVRLIWGGSEVLIIESTQEHAQIKDTEVCPCLPAGMGLGGGMTPMIVDGKHELSESDRLFKPRGASREL